MRAPAISEPAQGPGAAARPRRLQSQATTRWATSRCPSAGPPTCSAQPTRATSATRSAARCRCRPSSAARREGPAAPPPMAWSPTSRCRRPARQAGGGMHPMQLQRHTVCKRAYWLESQACDSPRPPGLTPGLLLPPTTSTCTSSGCTGAPVPAAHPPPSPAPSIPTLACGLYPSPRARLRALPGFLRFNWRRTVHTASAAASTLPLQASANSTLQTAVSWHGPAAHETAAWAPCTSAAPGSTAQRRGPLARLRPPATAQRAQRCLRMWGRGRGCARSATPWCRRSTRCGGTAVGKEAGASRLGEKACQWVGVCRSVRGRRVHRPAPSSLAPQCWGRLAVCCSCRPLARESRSFGSLATGLSHLHLRRAGHLRHRHQRRVARPVAAAPSAAPSTLPAHLLPALYHPAAARRHAARCRPLAAGRARTRLSDGAVPAAALTQPAARAVPFCRGVAPAAAAATAGARPGTCASPGPLPRLCHHRGARRRAAAAGPRAPPRGGAGTHARGAAWRPAGARAGPRPWPRRGPRFCAPARAWARASPRAHVGGVAQPRGVALALARWAAHRQAGRTAAPPLRLAPCPADAMHAAARVHRLQPHSHACIPYNLADWDYESPSPSPGGGAGRDAPALARVLLPRLAQVQALRDEQPACTPPRAMSITAVTVPMSLVSQHSLPAPCYLSCR